ncbi:hypothetical protein AB835_03695 [Candidatus Endobugula sertula]|uniref:Glycosyl transferase family 1 domain-containing protein n=1 Tax=Candidatus Endobugula sertula TaxID=62101 RepID=A0A1D2QS91_9GAMM|nr:hypothetical protein AB835_03695 [Candidatus Endobugula sertula]
MKYLMVLMVPFYKVDNNVIACESAFAGHLKELLPRVLEWGTEIVVHAPAMTVEQYQKNKHHLAHIECEKEKIFYIESVPANLSRAAFLLKAPFQVWPAIWCAVKAANVVHSSVSKDIFKLFTIMSLLFAVIQGKKTICIMDIDHRNSAEMLYKTGKFSLKSYLLSKYLYNPLIGVQLRFVCRYCHLVLLKGRALVEDYGKGRKHVKNFFNAAHDLSFVLSEGRLAEKLAQYTETKKTISLVYFGRVVAYKGIDDMVKATALVAEQVGAEKTVSLTIIGAGDSKESLQQQVEYSQLSHLINFHDAMNYGQELFNELSTYDFLLAAPKSEDTPRSVFDAMACGLPIIAYDTYYYKDLESTGAVKTVPWLSVQAMADKIIELSNDHHMTKQLVSNAREFAANNTQEIWLNKRISWTKEFIS